jgi:hypothetical protein
MNVIEEHGFVLPNPSFVLGDAMPLAYAGVQAGAQDF